MPAVGPRNTYPGNLTPYVTVTCIVAAMGGLSFGYDIGSSGGATSMNRFQKKFFPEELKRMSVAMDEQRNEYCQYNSFTLTAFMSLLYYAALVSSVFAGHVSRMSGRKMLMFFGGVLFFFGAVVNTSAKSLWMLIVGRILLGLGIGFIFQSLPLYLSETAPYKYRGALSIGFQLWITNGILVGNVLSYFTSKIEGGWGWRVSLGGAMVPAVIIMVGSLVLPDTPSSLIERGHQEEARRNLQRMRGLTNVDEEFNGLVAAGKASSLIEHPWRTLLQRKYRPQLTMAVLIPIFQQLAGINSIMFYAPVIFSTIGFGANVSIMSAVITGGVNVGGTLVSIYGVDRWGRRALFLEGGAQMFISQVVVTAAVAAKFGVDGDTDDDLPTWYTLVVVVYICTYVAGFAWSWGPLGWLVPSEIFPLEVRSAAQSVTVSVNMFFTFVMAQLFLSMLCHMKFGLFIFFAFFVLVMSAFVFFLLPETKGIPIDDMGRVWKNHWYWSRFVKEEDYTGQSV